jgi:hypothetical protein
LRWGTVLSLKVTHFTIVICRAPYVCSDASVAIGHFSRDPNKRAILIEKMQQLMYGSRPQNGLLPRGAF